MSDAAFFDERGRYVLPPMPDDLPGIIDYLLPSGLVKHALPRTPVQAVGGEGRTNAPMVCPQIPYGCRGWRVDDTGPWLPLAAIPEHWLPFLNRRRGTKHDFRRRLSD